MRLAPRVAMLVMALTLYALPALADDAAPLRQVVDVLMPLLGAILTVVVPWLTAAILRKIGADRNAQLSAAVLSASGRAAGIAYQVMLSQAQHLGDQPIRNVALAKGVGYLAALLPDAIRRLGLTPEALSRIVEAELGKLLAADPTVGIPAAPPPASPAAAQAPA